MRTVDPQTPPAAPVSESGKDSVTLRFVITGSYEAERAHYIGAHTPEEMAALDQDEIDGGGVALIDVLDWVSSNRDLAVKIEVVQ